MICEKATQESKTELIRFLQKSEDYSLFLLSNQETYGLELSNGLYSGNYKILRERDEILAAFCLTRKGTLLIQSTENNKIIFESILLACMDEKISISGVVGEWEFSHSFWLFLKEQKIIQKETYVSREVLYSVNLNAFAYLREPDARLLNSADFDAWVQLREAYVKEMGFPANSVKEMHEEFMTKVASQITWGLFLGGKLAAIADLNARFFDLGQLGGVYTVPALRNSGLSTRLVATSSMRQRLYIKSAN